VEGSDSRMGNVDEPGEGQLVVLEESEDVEMRTVENLAGLAQSPSISMHVYVHISRRLAEKGNKEK